MDTFSDYQRAAARTGGSDLKPENRDKGLNCAAMGLAGEAGEVCDLVKKVQHHRAPLDPAKLKKEAGDVLWYLAHLCNVMGWNLGEIAALKSRSSARATPRASPPPTASSVETRPPMAADGTPARVLPLDPSRRRPAARRSRLGALRAPGVEVLTDAELDDELAAAQSDADAALTHLLTCPLPRGEDGRDELVGRLASRLAMVAISRRETDASQVDVRDDHAATIDALVARLGAVRGAR